MGAPELDPVRAQARRVAVRSLAIGAAVTLAAVLAAAFLGSGRGA